MKRLLSTIVLACFLPLADADAAILFTYDFPGSQATNYLAVNQTNLQPANGTFSDFDRTNLLSTDANVLGSKGWTPGTSIDLAQHEGFTITAGAGFLLTLTQISFVIDNASDGPANFQIMLYVNGSGTAFDSSAILNTQGVNTTLTWDFTDVLVPDNATTAEFRFYGWDTASAGAHLTLDDVATSGSIVVPEPSSIWFGLSAVVFAAAMTAQDQRRRRVLKKTNRTSA